jgi:protein CpxP
MKIPSIELGGLALAGAIALAATAGVGASFAQPAPAAPPAEGHGKQRLDPAQMAERHAERLRAVLQLRPEQEPALRALIAALQPDPAKMERMRAERGQRQQMTTPQRLDRMQARMAERQAAFARKADAIRRFYGQLTPAQQRAFDAMPMMMGHGRHGGGMRGHGGHGPDGHGGPHGMGPGQPPPPKG